MLDSHACVCHSLAARATCAELPRCGETYDVYRVELKTLVQQAWRCPDLELSGCMRTSTAVLDVLVGACACISVCTRQFWPKDGLRKGSESQCVEWGAPGRRLGSRDVVRVLGVCERCNVLRWQADGMREVAEPQTCGSWPCLGCVSVGSYDACIRA